MGHRPQPLFPRRMAVNIAVDGVLAAMAVAASFWLANPARPIPDPPALPLAGALAVWLFGSPFGLLRLHWRYVSLRDLLLIGAGALAIALMLSLLLVGAGIPLPSPAFPVILALVLAAALIAPKVLYRLMRQAQTTKETVQTALLVGDHHTNELFLSAHTQQGSSSYKIVGLIALSSKHVGRFLHGLNVIGSVSEGASLFARLVQRPDLLIITSPDLSGDELKTLMQAASGQNIRVMRAPSLTHLQPADQKLTLQPIAIEDLLNRPQVQLDRDAMAALIAGRRVMVTGAGGSIGGELSRQLASFAPAEILLLESSEFALWQIDLEISEIAPALPRRMVIADVRDEVHIHAIMMDFRPDLVFHAAALKHVPIVEANKLEGLCTNALGTCYVANAAAEAGVKLMVLISTDKAVNPTSVMGASKRLAEMYAQALDVQARRNQGGMRCVTVRFGNVLGSTGSVVPLFRRQLAQGGPLTVTDPEMQRYFMTVREAVGLVLQASVVGGSEEAIPDGGIFVLDMGEPVKILDLARQMIRLAGLKPDQDIKIKFTGLRPGEKLFEELFHGAEKPVPTAHKGLLMATPRLVELPMIHDALEAMAHCVTTGNEEEAMTLICKMVPEFLFQTSLALTSTAD